MNECPEHGRTFLSHVNVRGLPCESQKRRAFVPALSASSGLQAFLEVCETDPELGSRFRTQIVIAGTRVSHVLDCFYYQSGL